MDATIKRSAHERDRWVESALLLQIVSLHPDRLTAEELVTRMEVDRLEVGRVQIVDALQALKRAGLTRITGEVVEPTHAALRAAELLE